MAIYTAQLFSAGNSFSSQNNIVHLVLSFPFYKLGTQYLNFFSEVNQLEWQSLNSSFSDSHIPKNGVMPFTQEKHGNGSNIRNRMHKAALSDSKNLGFSGKSSHHWSRSCMLVVRHHSLWRMKLGASLLSQPLTWSFRGSQTQVVLCP